VTLDRLRPLSRRLDPARRFVAESATRWRTLSARDRLAMGVAVLVMTLAVLWLAFTRPALESVTQWRRDLPKLRAQSAELDQLLSGVPVAQSPSGATGAQFSAAGLGEALQAALDRAGLQGLYRFQELVSDAPSVAGKAPPAKAWRIEFAEPVPAGGVFSWLVEVAARGDVEITSAVLDRTDSAADAGAGPQGRVRGRVDLQSRQLNKDGQ
jgi:type II secretory pathway component PulM